MTLDYIYHSGFAIETESVTVIIDYYKDSSETEHNRGIVHDYLLQRPGKLYVLATHFHPDHFNREILTWKEQRPDIQYIFSKDILKSHRAKAEDAFYIKKGETYEDDTIRIDAFGSTDVGSSFLLHLQDWSIFHAGDLNNWHWSEESTEEESSSSCLSPVTGLSGNPLINTVSSSSSWRLWKALRLYMLSYTCVVKRFNGASSMLISRARISPTRWLFILPVESPSTHNSAA